MPPCFHRGPAQWWCNTSAATGPSMDTTTLLDATRAAHFLGLALALGAAFQADTMAFRALRKPVDGTMLARLWQLHGVVVLGLAVLWASGLAIAWQKTGFQPLNISPKLTVKFGVVALLTSNALLMEAVVLPILRKAKGLRLGELPTGTRLGLGAIGGLSAGCWAAGLMLGVFTQLKALEMAQILPMVGCLIGLATLGGALVLGVAGPLLSQAAARHARAAEFALRR